jgi:hypothetical protein
MTRRSLAATTLCFAVLHAFAAPPATASAGNSNTPEERRVWMTVGERRFSITLADNEAARAFAALLPLTLDMPDLNGNEKHAKLPKALPANASRPGTISNGDLMLWGADTLVVFYLTFDSAYSYTRLGRIDDAAALPQSLGRGQVRIAFTKK